MDSKRYDAKELRSKLKERIRQKVGLSSYQIQLQKLYEILFKLLFIVSSQNLSNFMIYDFCKSYYLINNTMA